MKRRERPISQKVLERYQERAAVKLPDSASAPALFRKYLDDSIPEAVKKIHSFEFLDMEAAIQDVTKDTILSFGMDPNEDSTAHEIVRLTLRIRMIREQMERHRNSYALERSLLEMLDRRRDLLRLLRSEDYEQFLGLAERLDLDYQHDPRPGEAEPPQPGFPSRLAETRARCQQLKLRRLADLADRVDATKADFGQRRAAALKDAREKLAGLGLSLEQALEEVYAERRARAEADLLEDQLYWYYDEQRAHAKYVARMAEKAKAAAQKRR